MTIHITGFKTGSQDHTNMVDEHPTDAVARVLILPKMVMVPIININSYPKNSTVQHRSIRSLHNMTRVRSTMEGVKRDKVAYLRWSLTGPAAQLLWDGGFSDNLTYDELSQKVRQRFGSAGQEERYQGELRARKRKRGEQLQILYQDIRRLMSLAYPGETSRFSELIAKDAFLSALDDSHLELMCREHEPKDLDTALRIAMRLEQNEKAVSAPHANPHANRQTQIHDETVPSNRLADLERKVRSDSIAR